MSRGSQRYCAVPRVCGGRFAGRIFFSVWILSLGGLLTALGRVGCNPVAPGVETETVLSRATEGWRMEYWLPAGNELTPLVIEGLARRQPRGGVEAVIYRTGHDDRGATRLRQAGWTVVAGGVGNDGPGEPQLRIFSPGNFLAWTGTYRGDELKVAGATMLDDIVLDRLARGEPVPAWVPIGCAVVLSAGAKNMAGLPLLFNR